MIGVVGKRGQPSPGKMIRWYCTRLSWTLLGASVYAYCVEGDVHALGVDMWVSFLPCPKALSVRGEVINCRGTRGLV